MQVVRSYLTSVGIYGLAGTILASAWESTLATSRSRL